jgi:hypothetical protein
MPNEHNRVVKGWFGGRYTAHNSFHTPASQRYCRQYREADKQFDPMHVFEASVAN